MKENKKGFTLIELLAVLVVLAILALIAVPIVLNIINQARAKARLRSVEGFAKAAESSIYIYLTENSTTALSSITISDGSSHTGQYSIYVDGTEVENSTIDYSGSDVKGCQLDATAASNNMIKLINCTVGDDDSTITYENGAATYDDE